MVETKETPVGRIRIVAFNNIKKKKLGGGDVMI